MLCFCLTLWNNVNKAEPVTTFQIVKSYFHSYLVFINLKKMATGGNKKTTKNTPNKNSKEHSSVITMDKIEKMLEKSLNHKRKI